MKVPNKEFEDNINALMKKTHAMHADIIEALRINKKRKKKLSDEIWDITWNNINDFYRNNIEKEYFFRDKKGD